MSIIFRKIGDVEQVWDRWAPSPDEDEDDCREDDEPLEDDEEGYVYFIGPERGDAPVKIGTARNPVRRLAGLQSGHYERLVILGLLPGSFKFEKELHETFARDRVRGEWFRRSEAILKMIENAHTHEAPARRRAPPVVRAQVSRCDDSFLVKDYHTGAVYYRTDKELDARQFAKAINKASRAVVEDWIRSKKQQK